MKKEARQIIPRPNSYAKPSENYEEVGLASSGFAANSQSMGLSA